MSNPTELPDLGRLEALARAATPGPWAYQEDSDAYTHIVRPVSSPGWIIASATQTSKPEGKANGRWIAAANPAAVLALIEMARRAQPEGEAPQAALLQALIAVCDAALPVTNTAYNLGQNHEQWESIKKCIATLDSVRIQAHELIRALKSAAPAAQHAERSAQAAELPALPFTNYNGYSDGSEPLWTKEQMHEYARAALAAQSQGAQHPIGYITEDAAGTLKAGRGVPVSVTMRSTGPWHVPIYLAAQQAAAPGNYPAIPDGSTSALGTPEAPADEDAARYRWLRDKARDGSEVSPIVVMMDWAGKVAGDELDAYGIRNGAVLDAAVDRARAAQLDGGQGEGA